VQPDKTNPFDILSSTLLFENERISFLDHRVRNPAGGEQSYGIVHVKQPGIRILPVDAEGCTVLVGQHRFGAGFYSWELPAGGRAAEETPLAAAARELEEEAGLAAGRWLELFRFVSTGSIADDAPVAFLAWDLEPRPRHPEETEILELRRLPVPEALRLALDGEIRDAVTVATLLGAHLKARRGDLPEPVAAHLR